MDEGVFVGEVASNGGLFFEGREYEALAADIVQPHSFIDRSSRSQFQAVFQCFELVSGKCCIQNLIVGNDGAKTAANAVFLIRRIESSNWGTD